jgi:hypothetical protein
MTTRDEREGGSGGAVGAPQKMFARELGLHVEREHMQLLIRAIDTSLVRFRHSPGFKGLLCLEHDGLRDQVMIITLWDESGLAATAQDAEDARTAIAEATNTGVTSRVFRVLGHFQGAAGIPDVPVPPTPDSARRSRGDVATQPKGRRRPPTVAKVRTRH